MLGGQVFQGVAQEVFQTHAVGNHQIGTVQICKIGGLWAPGMHRGIGGHQALHFNGVAHHLLHHQFIGVDGGDYERLGAIFHGVLGFTSAE